MTFEDDALDAAYKSLESTEKFCDTSRKLAAIFNPSVSHHQEKLSPHERLKRKAIVADCLLFEAILVFLKQGVTSYVKGGYILRKAWKMYEKIFRETEKLCSQPSPIAEPTTMSPVDKHVGSSLYDREDQGGDCLPEEEEEEEEEGGEATAELDSSFGAVGESLTNMHFGFGAIDANMEDECPLPSASQNSQSDASSTSSQDSGSHGNASKSHEGPHSSKTRPQSDPRAFLGVPTHLPTANGSSGTSSKGSSRSNSEENLHSISKGVDEVDAGKHGKGSKRPKSGYFLPEVETSLVHSLEHEDARLRGAVYFGYGLMNIIMSLIPPRLMKLANLFGFQGNRRVGLQALEFASNSQDMKAPLARLVSGCALVCSMLSCVSLPISRVQKKCRGYCLLLFPIPFLSYMSHQLSLITRSHDKLSLIT